MRILEGNRFILYRWGSGNVIIISIISNLGSEIHSSQRSPSSIAIKAFCLKNSSSQEHSSWLLLNITASTRIGTTI
jgi:hypothetical protein